MKKSSNSGFMLAEALIVTTFVAGILIFMFIQFSNLNKNYNESYRYNTVEGLYALKNIRNYIENDINLLNLIKDEIDEKGYFDMSQCEIVTNKNYCLKLLELENIKQIYITENNFNSDLFISTDNEFKKFANKIDSKGLENYRLLAEFTNSTYATIRFGD